jgi:citrate synthase
VDEQPRMRSAVGVVVLESSISSIEPTGLRYRGIAIDELVTFASYEEVAWLLLTGSLPSASELEQIYDDLAAGAVLPDPVWNAFEGLPAGSLPIARMQAVLPVLGLYVPALVGSRELPAPRRAVRLMGAFAALAGSANRGSRLQAVIAAEGANGDKRGVASIFMSAMNGDSVPAEDVQALEEVLILYADHELNASTFAGRVTASTRADLVSSVLAALCALRGPLHGGIDRFVRSMLAAVEHEGVDSALERYVRSGTPLPGFGHAVYRGMDPRAVLMRDLARRLAERTGERKFLELTETVEGVASYRRLPAPNVDLYAVAVYQSLRVPDDLTTLVFATGRMAGWCAHVLEQYEDNRLIRPRAAYIGPDPRTLSEARSGKSDDA